MKRRTKDVVIVGGGAAGLFAAAHAAERGLSVVLIEKNKVMGRKLAITGKGRCNVTNDSTAREVMDGLAVNGKFLWSAFTAYPPEKTMDFFESLGVPLKTERGRRVFPASDRAEDIVSALVDKCRKGGVEFIHGRVKSLMIEDGRAVGVSTDKEDYPADNVLICTGGLSYPGTGSDGDGYAMAESVGHRIVTPRPSLVPLTSPDADCVKMQGFAPKNVVVSLHRKDGKVLFEEMGEMLFTHFGVSGPLILSASAHLKNTEGGEYILIDFKPALDEEKLDERILRDFSKFANREFENSLGELVARSMIPVVVERSGIPPRTKVNSVTREQRRNLVRLLKAFRVDINGTRSITEAIITSGGVDVKEIDPKTMESKIVKNLYFAGEIIDADAYTGGYNLQIAWSTAYAAASHISAE